jgi:hypothetical protein
MLMNASVSVAKKAISTVIEELQLRRKLPFPELLRSTRVSSSVARACLGLCRSTLKTSPVGRNG